MSYQYSRIHLTLATATLVVFLPTIQAATNSPLVITKEQAVQAFASLSVPFEENLGQTNSQVAFQAKTLAGPLFVTKDGELVWSLSTSPAKSPMVQGVKHKHYSRDSNKIKQKTYSVVEKFVSGIPKPNGNKPSSIQVSYFHGANRNNWQANIPTWEQVSLGQVWPGIEVQLAARGNNVEKLFTVAAGADVNQINLQVSGGNLTVASNGGLRVENENQSIVTFSAPLAWQVGVYGEKQPVAVAYRLAATSPNQYGFSLGTHDVTRPVLIDPLLQSTYLGGNGNDQAYTLAVTSNAVYVAGYTSSSNYFPGITGGAQINFGGNYDAFIAKFSVDLRSLNQVSYLGGTGYDSANALAVTNDAVYVVGDTDSSDFPKTSGGAQASIGGTSDGFVAKLSSDLKTLTLSSYLGGSNDDAAYALAVTDSSVYVVGGTFSSNFPNTSNGAQPVYAGEYNVENPEYGDAFVAKLNLNLTSPMQASYLGGSGNDGAYAIAVDNTTNNATVYVVGGTWSSNFPNTNGGAQATFGGCNVSSGGCDGFIAKFSHDLHTIYQSSFLGGNNYDAANALAITKEAVYVAGDTGSTNFPVISGGAQGTIGGLVDGYIAKLSLDIKTLTQSSYLGGNGVDSASGIAATNTAVYVGGYTESNNFPGTTTSAILGTNNAFVAKVNLDLHSSIQASYLGGNKYDAAYAIAVTDSAVYAVGNTWSKNFPYTYGGVQGSLSGGDYDAFVTKISPDLVVKTVIVTPSVTTNGSVNPSIGGSISPDIAQILNTGTATIFTITPKTGFAYNNVVGGTCPQSSCKCWNGNEWTTGIITANCTVAFSFRSILDFAITNVSLTPAIPNANSTFTAAVTVTNQSNVGFDGGILDVWNHQPTNQTCDAVGSKWQAVGFLAGKTSKIFTFSGLLAGNAGMKMLRALVDSSCTTIETNEINNQNTYIYAVNQANSNVDLVITGITLNPTISTVNSTFTATVTVKNNGTVAADGKFLDVWSHQPNGQVCAALGDKRLAVGSLAAGATKSLTFNGLPAGSAGMKMLRAYVDSCCDTAETNEANNQYTQRLYPVNQANSNVDLAITGITLNPAAPTTNGTFTAAVTVKNQGTVPADGKFLDVWSHQPNGQVCGAVGDKRLAVGSLAAGATKVLNVTGLPAGTAGMKMLRAYVDSGCGTAETNEANNQYTQRLYPVNQANSNIDLAITGITLNPTAPTANGTFTAAVTVKNQGTVPADGKFLDVWSHQPNGQVCGAVGDKRLAVGSLAAGATKVLTFTGLPAGGTGMKMLRAYVDSGCGTAETNEANNQLTKSYTVQ